MDSTTIATGKSSLKQFGLPEAQAGASGPPCGDISFW
jgi:hypothetical protein